MRGRALALAGAFAVLDAHAHGGVPPGGGAAILIALGGIVACIVVPLAVGSGRPLARWGTGTFVAVVDFFVWILLVVTVTAWNQGAVGLPEWVVWTTIGFLVLFPWIIPAVLLVYLRAKRARLA